MTRIKLVENIVVQVDKDNIEVFDKPILFESEGQTYSKRGILKRVPVTRFVENLNGRVYLKELWENVKKSGKFNGSMCIADHPEDDGSVKDYCGVWSNFQVHEDVATADLTVVGEYGQLMLEIVEAKGKVGFSTVGTGEFKEDQKTVDPISYDYERTDFVTVPSQQVFASKENLGENKVIDLNILNNITNNKEIINEEIKKQENKVEVNSMADNKIQELAFINQINRTIKEAKKNDNFSDAIDDLTKLKVPTEMTEEKANVQQTINNLQEKLEASKKNLEEKVIKGEESLNDTKAKYEVQSKMLESMKSKFQKIDDIIKENGLEGIGDIQTMKESITDAVHDIGILKEEKVNLLSDLKTVMAERVDMLKDIKVFLKKEDLSEAKTSELEEAIESLQAELKHNEGYIADLEKTLKKEGYKIVEADDKKDKKDDKKKDDKKDDEEVKDSDSDDDKMAKLRAKKKESDEEKTLKGNFSHLEESEKNKDDKKDDEELEESDDEIEDDEIEEKKEAKKKKESDDEEELEESDDEDEIEESDDEDEIEEKKKAKKKESYRETMFKAELTQYFNEQVKSFPGIKDFKEEIITSKSFIDASKKIEKIQENTQNEQVKFSEIKLDDSWIPNGRR